MSRSDAILAFWFGRPGDRDFGKPRPVWFGRGSELEAAEFDRDILANFAADYKAAAAGAREDWKRTPRGCLALVLTFDQFPRNMFRGSAKAFASDGKARMVAEYGIEQGHDAALNALECMFLYMPFQHSEDLATQRRSVELFRSLDERSEMTGSIHFAARHLEIIERFGRFPHRNAALDRQTTPEEAAFLKEPDSAF